MKDLRDLEISGKRVLIREDLNVPVKDGQVTDDTRIDAVLPTIQHAVSEKARVIIVSHLGRPREGEFDESQSLAPVARRLGEKLGQEVRLVRDWADGVEVDEGEAVMLENIRFEVGEKSDDEQLARRLAALCDIYCNDAFGTAHRAQASTHGVARLAPVACAGPLLLSEIEALSQALEAPARPMVAIVGGAKVSTKLSVLEKLIEKVDTLIVGGGIANTFLKAAGHPIGKSLCEDDLVADAKRLYDRSRDKIPLPEDVVCASEPSEGAVASIKPVGQVADDDMILDVGPRTVRNISQALKGAGTIVWNGPLGMFEIDQFGSGTWHMARAISESDAFSIAGGGDTLAAIAKYGIGEGISYISTGGGAFLEYLEGRTLPAVAALEARAED